MRSDESQSVRPRHLHHSSVTIHHLGTFVMRHLNAHRKLGRTSEHRMSMLRNLATSLINARDERIITTVPKAKELSPFVERVITLAKRAGWATGDDAGAQSLHL